MSNRNNGKSYQPADDRKAAAAAPKRQLPPDRRPLMQRADELLQATERELSVTRLQRDDYLLEWQMAEQFIRQLEDHYKLPHSRPDQQEQPPTPDQAKAQAEQARDKPVQNGKAPSNVVPLPAPAQPEKETADAAGPQ